MMPRHAAFFASMACGLAFTISCTPTPAATPVNSAPAIVLATASGTATLPPTLPPTLSPPLPPTPATQICSPLGATSLEQLKAIITQPFIAPSVVHDREHPDWVQKDDGHHGLDLGSFDPAGKLVTGLPVQAALAGRIAALIHDRPPYGNMLMIETPFAAIPAGLVATQKITPGDSLYSLYGHLQNMLALKPGQPVACGQALAETGMTGFTSGPHLHFETRWGPPGESFASMAYYRADASAEEMANYERWRMSAEFHLFDPMEVLMQGK